MKLSGTDLEYLARYSHYKNSKWLSEQYMKLRDPYYEYGEEEECPI